MVMTDEVDGASRCSRGLYVKKMDLDGMQITREGRNDGRGA